MPRKVRRGLKLLPWAAALLVLGGALFNFSALSKTKKHHPPKVTHRERLFREGRATFRYDTFGDEQFWTGALKLEKAIEGSKHGGVGGGLSPKTALGAGLKVDAAALPKSVLKALKKGKVDLDDPATTLALLKLNAVVGVKGTFNRRGTKLASVGITCAVCHSTVNNSVAPGVGNRLDGWPNRDLNVGAVISLAPDLSVLEKLLNTDEATVKKVLASWGPGQFDAELTMDGKAFRPDGGSASVLIPPAYGLDGVNLATWTGWGSVTYWNAFVANLEMHGVGNFHDARLDDENQFPVAAKNGFGHVSNAVDRITPRLGALEFYQLGLKPPKPPKGSFNAAAARRGKAVFDGQGKCATCHVPPIFSEPGQNLHTPQEVCTDAFTADRSPTHMYRTAPLRGLFAHTKGGFYHDGRYKRLADVVNHYDDCFHLGLGTGQKHDLIEYLKSL